MAAAVRIGLSGWTYPHWRGVFYPRGLPQRRELEFAAATFDTLELNGSFYSLQRPSSYRRWRAETPARFVFAIKGSRYITHLRKLAGVEAALANFLASGPLLLGDRLGPLLWQLPPMLPFHRARLDSFFSLLPRTAGQAAQLAAGHESRLPDLLGEDPATMAVDPAAPLHHALEVRHASYATGDCADLCRERGVALVVADTAGRFAWVDEVTADVVYVRLHGDRELYTSGYTDEGIAWWADRIIRWADTPGVAGVHVYFDNDAQAHAPYDALRLAARLGMPRTPPARLPYG